MRKLIMWNLVTLDGCFEGEKPWDLAWHELVWGEELEHLSIEQLGSADMLVFGRATYEGMAAYWTTAQGEVADYMNSLPKVVCSRSLHTADWNNSILIKDDTVAAIEKLKQQGDGNMFLFGSANLSNTLINADLFDEYRIGIVPIILGKGRQLFTPEHKQQHLKLIENHNTSTDCVIVRYRRDRSAETNN